MYFGQLSPWMMGQQQGGQGGQGGQPGMTPGAGMPPYGQNAPMPMGQRQMQPGGAIPSQHAQMPQQGMPINPAQMGMLAGMMRQNTQQPGGATPWSGISPQSMEGVIPGQTGAQTKGQMQALAPDSGIMDWLRQSMLGRMFTGGGQQ